MGECCVSFPGPVSRKTMSYLVIDYLKYILYYRGQFPLPLDQLKIIKTKSNKMNKEASEISAIDGHLIFCDESDQSISSRTISSKNVTSSRSKQKFFESISKFDEFFNELTVILETKTVLEIVLNLGPNLMTPKELYHIVVPRICSNEECLTDYAPLQNCKVQFFRNIISSDIWTDLSADSLFPVSVMLLLEHGDTLDKHMEQKRFYALPKTCKHRTLRFTDFCTHSKTFTVEENSSTSENPTSSLKTRLWVKLKPDLKGFKSFNESN